MDYSLEQYYGYDEYGNLIDSTGMVIQEYTGIPEGHVHDEFGRLLKPANEIPNENYPEDYGLLISCWQKQKVSPCADWPWTSKIAWPDLNHTVLLRRLDIFESDMPQMQQATTDIELSRRIRNTPGWTPVQSVFFLDKATPLTTNLLVETTGPPKRNRYRLEGKENQRDFSTWIKQEILHAYIGADRIPGTCNLYSDFRDLPDRYFLSSDPEPLVGSRRLYRFAAYTATQYFILEKRVFSEQLSAEGGYGMSYTIERGPVLTAMLGWRLIGSFFGFDHQLQGSSKYTIYRRQDPFPRMIIALDSVQRPEEWDSSLSFYAFDIAIPGTVLYTLQHCLRSIHSAEASIPRHRLTTEYPKSPWEFRMNIYVFPAALEDCTCNQTAPTEEGYY